LHTHTSSRDLNGNEEAEDIGAYQESEYDGDDNTNIRILQNKAAKGMAKKQNPKGNGTRATNGKTAKGNR
jgi:hypothetical protein